MPAGRPRRIDPLTLYALAKHFYGELMTLQEGLGWRIVIDEAKHERLMKEAEETSLLCAEALTRVETGIDRQIQLGYLPAHERESRIHAEKESIEFSLRFAGLNSARDSSKKFVRVPGEPKIIEKLLNAKKQDQVRKICADAFTHLDEYVSGEIVEVRRPNWPISDFSLLPEKLSQYASEFIEAKNDPRFPASDRPTSRQRQLWFIARALAGAVHGISTRTAINQIGSVRPDEAVEFSKRTRRPKKTRKKS